MLRVSLLVLALILAQASNSYDDFFDRAEAERQKSEWDKVMRALRSARNQQPERPEAYIAMGEVLMTQRKDGEALEVLRKAASIIKLKPSYRSSRKPGQLGGANPSAVHANLATILYQSGDPLGAAQECEEALNYQPDHARCLYIYGVACMTGGRFVEPGDWKKIEQSLKASIKLMSKGSSEMAAAYYALGSLYSRLSRMQDAWKAFEPAARLQPDNAQFLMKVGEMRSRMGKHEAAEEIFRRACELRPGDAEPQVQVGNAVRRQGRLDEALTIYRKAGKSDKASGFDVADAKYWEGSVLEMQDKKGKAEKAYRTSLKNFEHHPRALNNLAGILMARSDPEAYSLYEKAIRSDPHMFEAYNNLGGYLMVDGKPGEALPLLQFAVSQDSSEPQLIFNLGLAHRKLGNYKEAIPLMREALRRRPTNKDYLWELARAYHYQNQSGLALSTLVAMTRTLHEGWDSLLNPEDGVAVDAFIHTGNGKAIKFYDQAPKRPKSNKRKANGIILYLCCADNDELNDLHYSLKLLNRFYTSSFPYPVLILHDIDLDPVTLQAAAGHTELIFHRFKFDFPGHMTPADISGIPPKLHLAGHNWGYGYRHMSRFFCHSLYDLPIVQGYDYYWRLDADSFLLTPIQYDVFQRMEDEDKVYGYMVVTSEDKVVVKGLWNTTKEYIDNEGITPKFLHKHMKEDGSWNRDMYYTNFEISRFDFWRSEKYRDFFNWIDKSNGIYMHRWGDAPIHLLAITLLLPEERVLRFGDIGYWHQYYVNLPEDFSKRRAKSKTEL